MADDDSGSPREQMEKRHRRELKDMQAKITGLRKSVPKGDKKKKKEITAQIALLEEQTAERHQRELDGLAAGGASAAAEGDDSAAAAAAAEDDGAGPAAEAASGGGGGKSKAQRRREKKEAEERERAKRIADGAVAEGESAGELETEAITANLLAKKLRIHKIPADGHCMFRATQFLLAAQGRTVTIEELRSMAVKHIRAHADDFRPFMTNSKGDMLSDAEFDAYLQEMRDTACWGGQCELRALAQTLETPIVVHQASGPEQHVGEDQNAHPAIHLSFHRHQFGAGEHYNAVVPIE